MKVVHELDVMATCPADKKPDVYRCVILVRRVLPVEDILTVLAELDSAEMYQEVLCQELHRRLRCTVRLTGYHSQVRTTVVCGSGLPLLGGDRE